MEVVEAIDVKKTYAQGEVTVHAVRGIDLVVRKGELLSIIGPSGSGKSTLLTMLGAIETPTSGKILLEGVDYASLSDDERTLLRRRRIGFIFQAFNLIPTLTALENVALPLELDGIREDGSPHARRRDAHAGRPRRPAGSLAQRHVRRPAATRRRGPGAGDSPRAGARRRADRATSTASHPSKS